MKPNPGGKIIGEAIIDREQEIAAIWNALQGKSVVLSSERRVGKTSVLQKMFENPKDDWTPVLYYVEGKYHPIEFVEGLYDLLLKNNVIEENFWQNLKRVYTKYAGGEQIGSWVLPQIKENWKTLLETTIEVIFNSNKKVLLMFDEVPLMLYNFKKSYGPQLSMEFLDTMREIRNKYEASKKIAFILCGSIGIEMIIKDLKHNHGYNSDPVNNMKKINLSGMDKHGVRLLCEKLSEDEDYRIDNPDELFAYLSQSVDNLPFYIQHIFAYINDSGKKIITKDMVDEAITYLINDPNDEAFFNHYLDRIKTYYNYKKEVKGLALAILNKMCRKSDFWNEHEIVETLMNDDDLDTDIETIKDVLNLLWSDNYLVRQIVNDERAYKFKYGILQKWWRVNRG